MESSRRQQSERTAATRGAVLEATLSLLVERGYAGTSTRLAADRAGVSLGALQHHFRTKAELTVEAMRFVTERLAEEFVAAVPDEGGEIDRYIDAIDRLYVVFRGPTFAAAVELHLAARTDETLHEPIRSLHADVERIIFRSAAELMPGMHELPGFEGLLQTTVSSLRGLALMTMEPVGDPGGEWPVMREYLIGCAAGLIGKASA